MTDLSQALVRTLIYLNEIVSSSIFYFINNFLQDLIIRNKERT